MTDQAEGLWEQVAKALDMHTESTHGFVLGTPERDGYVNAALRAVNEYVSAHLAVALALELGHTLQCVTEPMKAGPNTRLMAERILARLGFGDRGGTNDE